MPRPDGTIVINTKIDSSGLNAGFGDIEKTCKSAAISIDQIGSTIEKVGNMGNQIKSPDLTEIDEWIAKLEQKYETLAQKQERFLAIGGSTKSKTFQGMEYDLEELRMSLEAAKAEREDLISSGGGYLNTSAEEKLGNAVQKLGGQMDEYAEKTEKGKKETNGLANAQKRAADTTNKHNINLKGNLKTILKYAFGIRSLFVLVNKLRRAFLEGVKNLAQYDKATNESVSALKSSLATLKNAFAAAFAPIINFLAPLATKLTDFINEIVSNLGMLIAKLSGQTTFIKAKKIQEDYAESLKDTADAAKEAQGYLSGLDQIKTYSEDKSSSISGGAKSPADMFETVSIPPDAFGIDTFLSELEKKLPKSIERIAKTGVTLGKSVAANFKGAFNKYITKNAARIENHLAKSLNLGEKIVDNVSRGIESVGGIASHILESDEMQTLEASMAGIYTNARMSAETLALTVADGVSEIISKPFIDNAPQIEETIMSIISPASEALESIDTLSGEISDHVDELSEEHLSPFFSSIADGISKVVGKITDTWNEYVKPVLEEAGQFFSETVTDKVSPTFEKLFKFIGKLIDITKKLFENVVVPVVSFISEVFVTKLSTTFDFLLNQFSLVLGGLSEIVGDVFDIFSGVIDFITDVFSGDWSAAWEDVKNIFKSIWDTMADIIKVPINLIIGAINSMIDAVETGINFVISGINKISFTVPDWVPVIGGEDFGFNLDKVDFGNIPYLAKGAVIPPNAPFAAVLGDQTRGYNIEAPEDLIRKIVREESGKGGMYQFTAQINRKTLFDEMIEEAKMRKRQTGREPFSV